MCLIYQSTPQVQVQESVLITSGVFGSHADPGLLAGLKAAEAALLLEDRLQRRPELSDPAE